MFNYNGNPLANVTFKCSKRNNAGKVKHDYQGMRRLTPTFTCATGNLEANLVYIYIIKITLLTPSAHLKDGLYFHCARHDPLVLHTHTHTIYSKVYLMIQIRLFGSDRTITIMNKKNHKQTSGSRWLVSYMTSYMTMAYILRNN